MRNKHPQEVHIGQTLWRATPNEVPTPSMVTPSALVILLLGLTAYLHIEHWYKAVAHSIITKRQVKLTSSPAGLTR